MNLQNCLIFLLFIDNCFCIGNYVHNNWKFHFPEGSNMGLFLAIALPLDLPKKNAYLAYNFEANFQLPNNKTNYLYPPLVQKRMNRKMVYEILESKIESNGYYGRECLLRTICEAAANTFDIANGILGDILHIILTPSTSINENLPNIYQEAEKEGKLVKNCFNYEKNCSISFLDLFSWIENSI